MSYKLNLFISVRSSKRWYEQQEVSELKTFVGTNCAEIPNPKKRRMYDKNSGLKAYQSIHIF